ncbi:hypothetical protein HC251_22220 [Iamia sp. SCSIO 61187]|uniref:hypothetical protein n=1 Tax=Iamia sp. SCSIO 61187 TaxID=2722752 RepID=UPI001C6330EA|nr:hypothetical protein [Iamia sp. SCSIO 61187]QYG94875.1 hypothetical protein HC251_22220 [Iamia sp. SCSIO 61187]
MTVLRISGLLWRRGGARQWTVLAMSAAGVLAATTLALLALSVSPALGARGDRVAWRTPMAAADPDAATAVQRTMTDAYRGREITRVELAPTGRGTVPLPPGVDAVPGPGEVVVSPALADLLASEPAAALGDRLPGTIVGQVGPEGRAIDADLVAVVGRAEGEIAVDGTPIVGYDASGETDVIADYRVMAQIAAVLLVVPTLLLVGALARLTAAQREQRLAGLRLVGATPGLVVAVTALETALAALAGAVGGVALYAAVLPAAARIELGGSDFAVADLWLGAGALAAAVVLVPLLAAGSATVALRKVVIGPLGVSSRVGGRRPRLVRLLVVPVAWLALTVSAAQLGHGGSVVPVLLGLGAVIGTLAVVGPLLTWLVGAALAHLGRRPGPVLAGRRITDDARGTYRAVSGMVMAGLIAGFLFGVIPTVRAVSDSVEHLDEATDLYLSVAGPADGEAVRAVERAVAEAVPGTEVAGWSSSEGEEVVTRGTVVAEAGTDVEVVRTAILAADPTAGVSSLADIDAEARLMVEDLGRASVVMSLAALGLATVATAIGSTASILDQRVTLTRLRLAGTSLEVLQRARRWQAMVPLGLASIGAMASGAGAAQLLMVAAAAEEQPVVGPDVVPMAGLGLAALAAGAVAVALTRPVLVAATRDAPRE